LWLYYITDRKQLGGTPAEQKRRLLDKIAEAARAGVEFIQLREKDLSSRALEHLARDAAAIVRENSSARAEAPTGVTSQQSRPRPRLLINSRLDIAISTGADGVHLPAHDLTPVEARAIWDTSASLTRHPRRHAVIGVSCPSADDVRLAQAQGADFAVFAPVFEKLTINPPTKQAGVGLDALRTACGQVLDSTPQPTQTFPVFALGGVTLENAQQCLQAGAVGVAGIRLFQQNDVKSMVDRLRNFQ
jgi:thiamine-phosphate pyrophosphorylase